MADLPHLFFEIEPGTESWTIRAPPSLSATPHTVASPLQDERFLGEVRVLREWASRPVLQGDPSAAGTRSYLDRLSRQVGERITTLLLAKDARAALATALRHPEGRRAHLTVRVRDAGGLGDEALALPWELLAPEPGAFALQAQSLQLTREVLVDGAPDLPPPAPALAVAVMIAAPEDRAAIPYEEESFRLQLALSPLGHDVAFSDLGGLRDLVQQVEDQAATVIHFSGHGLPGRLVFENDLGFAEEVAVAEVQRQLHQVLLNPRRTGSFPRLFFLSSCHGAARDPSAEASPSAAAALHRYGFAQVVGYFGPLDPDLSIRAEETFYRVLARGETVLSAAAALRETLAQPLGEAGERIYPLAWAQLAVYHRGPVVPLALCGMSPTRGTAPARRRMIEVSGLPVLERGFIGRRGLQHEVLRKVRGGLRLLVLQGLGGLGKTALASQLISRIVASDAADQLVLRCRELGASEDPILDLQAQAEEHGRVHSFLDWDERMKNLRAQVPEAAAGFGAVVRQIWRERPHLVIYADNAESLQSGPEVDEVRALGSWRPGIDIWWDQMEQLAEDGLLVLASTRYAWQSLNPHSHLGVDPMSPADSLRLIASFEQLSELPAGLRKRLAQQVDGHPRTVEFLDRLVGIERAQAGAASANGAWGELIETLLPRQERMITSDLLLTALWNRLSEAAQEQARRLPVLRTAAPAPVLDHLGERRDELIRAGWLTRYREQVLLGGPAAWMDLWGLHPLVRRQELHTSLSTLEQAHRMAGEGYELWLQSHPLQRLGQREAIYHFYRIREGGRVWPIVQDHTLWLRDRGRFVEAVQVLEDCENAGVTGEPLGLALMLLAQLRKNLGDRSDQLASLLERGLSLVTQPENRSVLLHEYGSLLSNQGRHAEAEVRLREALALDEESPGGTDGAVGYTLHTLANLLFRQGKHAPAEETFRRALSIKRAALGADHPDYAASLHTLALVLLKEGKTSEAEETLHEALEVKKKALGEGHPSYATSLHSLAEVVGQAGRFTEAEGLLRQAAAVKADTLGPTHPSVGVSLQTLAGIVLKLGRPAEALELMRRALPIQTEALGPDHPSVAASLQTLGLILSERGELGEAETCLRQALAAQQSRLGDRHAAYGATLYTLAGVLNKQGEHRQAEEILKEVLALFEVAVGPDHPYRVAALATLAETVAGQDRFSEALAWYLEALDLSTRIQSPDHPQTGQILYGAARLQHFLGRSEAAEMAQRAATLLFESLGGDHPTTLEARALLRRITG